MTKKELSQLYYLKKEIQGQQRRIKELETLATRCSTTITGMPHGMGISDRVGKYASELSDLKNLLDLNIKKCFFELNKLDRYIQSVSDSLIRQIMIYRFINGYSWAKIAWNIGGKNTADGLRIKLKRFLQNTLSN